MEIKRVSNETYESIELYLKSLVSVCSSLNNLCMIEDNKHRYMVSQGNDGLGIVEDSSGIINSYYLFDNEDSFETPSAIYNLTYLDGLIEIRKKVKETADQFKLSYLSSVDNFEKCIIEYIQYIEDNVRSLRMRYDVSDYKNDLSSSIKHTFSQFPDDIVIEQLKNILFYWYKTRKIYSIGLQKQLYYEPLIAIGDLYFGEKFTATDPKELINIIKNLGFKKNISADLMSLLNIKDKNNQYNRLCLVKNAYKEFNHIN